MTTKTLTIPSKFGDIPAILYTPKNPIDLCVVMFHGKGEVGGGNITGADSLDKLLNSTNHANLIKNAEVYGFSVLAPQLIPKWTNWQIWWMPEYSNYCVDFALKNLTKQPKVPITGLSQGGGACWSAMTDKILAPKIMCAIPICPTGQYEGDFSLIAANHIPVWNFHAVNDTMVSVKDSRNLIALATKHNPDPPIKFEELASGGHYIWGGIYDRPEIYNWMMLQYKPIPEPIPEEDPIVNSYQITEYKSGKIEAKKLTF